MLTTLQQEIENVLKEFPNYWDNDVLLKNVLIEDIRNYKPEILSALLKNPTIKKTYSLDINGLHIFKVEEFVSMLRYKNYLENSYTKFSNEIGLTTEGKSLKYVSDVILDFPHKDGILEGGMTKEDSSKEEIYYHNILAKEEIDTLLYPKVLANIKRHDENGFQKVSQIQFKDNLILKGNNLIALYALKDRYAGKVKLIYIDPPYNTGNDSFNYNDRFNHSTWLAFMKNRLEVAYDLLSEDGVIFISLDDKEAHYCKVLVDQIFGRENFIADICHKSRASVSNDKIISSSHNHLLMFAKNERIIFKSKQEYGIDPDLTGFNQIDDLGEYKLVPVDGPGGAKKGNPFYEVLGIKGYWRFSKEKMLELYAQGKVVKKGSSLYQKYYKEQARNKRKTITTWWDDNFLTSTATSDLKKIFEGQDVFNNPKNEKLLKRIIEFTTKEQDIILDFFMGSATTQAVAMKMNRQFIGIEQMDYINTVSVPRLQKVIEGEQGGISKEVEWQGGGSFVYAELFELNHVYINELQKAVNPEEIEALIHKIKNSPFLNIKVDLEKLLKHKDTFFELTLDEQKLLLIQVLDNNQLYLNYSEIDDDQYAIDDQTKAFNRSFYQEEV